MCGTHSSRTEDRLLTQQSLLFVVISQHTPVVCITLVFSHHLGSVTVQNSVPEFSELAPLQWFREEITEHFTGRTVLDTHLTALYTIRHEKIANVDVSGALPTGGLPIFLHQHGALVVLVYL